jgi:hypothetical protein
MDKNITITDFLLSSITTDVNIQNFIIGFFVDVIYGVVSFIITIILFNLYIKKLKSSVTFQTYIYADPKYVICTNDKYNIEEIPDILTKYRKKLYATKDQEELFFWNTRISTFILFTDGNKVLVYLDRNNKKNQNIFNPKLDCHGAVKFHNPSLEFKLSPEFMKSKIHKFEAIPGISLEQTNKKIFDKYKIPFYKEVIVMIGFIAHVSTEDLQKGIDEKNSIIDINCLSIDDDNLTAKIKLGLKYL